MDHLQEALSALRLSLTIMPLDYASLNTGQVAPMASQFVATAFLGPAFAVSTVRFNRLIVDSD